MKKTSNALNVVHYIQENNYYQRKRRKIEYIIDQKSGMRELGRKYNVWHTTIMKIKNKLTWKHIPLEQGGGK